MRVKWTSLSIISTLLLFGLSNYAQAYSSAYERDENDTLELKSKSMSEDWLYPLRYKESRDNLRPVTKDNHVKLGFSSLTPEISLSTGSGENVKNVEITTHSNMYSAISYTHRNYGGVSMMFTSPPSDGDREIYGPSKGFGASYVYDHDNYALQLHYAQQRGFYIKVDDKSTGDDDDDTNSSNNSSVQPKVQLPDMYVRTFGADISFITVPHQYSLRAIESQTIKQFRSGGSPLLNISIKNEKIHIPKDSSNTIAATQKANSALGNDDFELSATTVIPSLGYGYQWNFTENFFFNGQFHLGYGYGHINMKSEGQEKTFDQGVTRTRVTIALAYNGTSNYYGLLTEASSQTYEIKSDDVGSQLLRTNIYYGYRF